MKKQCTKCKTVYSSLQHFNRDKQKKDGFTSHCRRCMRESRLLYNENNREKQRAYAKIHYSANKKRKIQLAKERRTRKVKELFRILGEKCELCSESNRIILQIDHKKGGGYRHRKVSGCGEAYYTDMLRHPTDYRLLCANCNLLEAVRNNQRKSIWS